MRAALLIAGKDLRQRLRDRSALLMALVVPLVLASIFGLIFHDVGSGRVTFDFGLVGGSPEFRARALAPLEQQGLITVHRQPSEAAARDAIAQHKLEAAFIRPGESVRVIGDTDAPIGTQVAQSIAEIYADNVETHRTLARAGAGGDAAVRSVVAIDDVSTRSRQLDAGTFYAAGMAVLFLFFTVQFGVSSIIDERRDGTLARMLVAPIPRAAVVVGKLLTSLVLGVVSMAVLAIATHLLLGAHWGDPVAVGLLILAGVLAATATMAVVVTVARTPDQAQAWQAMVALVLGMLGGTFFPIAQAGGLLAGASLLAPQAWFLRGIQDLAGGGGPGDVLGPVAAMLAFTVVLGAVALARAGRLVAR